MSCLFDRYSHHFFKAIRDGLIKADIIALPFLGWQVYLFRDLPMNDPMAVVTLKIVGVIYVSLTVATFYAYMIHKAAYRRARLLNLDRVHPLQNGRRRVR